MAQTCESGAKPDAHLRLRDSVYVQNVVANFHSFLLFDVEKDMVLVSFPKDQCCKT